MANSVLPEELMLCILTRLPVKTIIRFKSVCKPWYRLFSTPEFKKLHQAQFSIDPKNQSFIVHSFDRHCSEPKNQFSIFNIESGNKRPTILNHPFANAQNVKLDTVGCCSGLICIGSGQEIVLWNPAMKLFKTVPLKDLGHSEMMSLGFGYDAIGDDFKVIRVVGVGRIEKGEGMNVTYAEIYSVNLGSWITIDVSFHFIGPQTKNIMIVNGNPYWVARVDGNEVLVCFDVLELVFKIVPLPPIYGPGLDEKIGTEKEIDVEFVDWNGVVGAIVFDCEVENLLGYVWTVHYSRLKCVWVFDDIEGIWRNHHTFRTNEVDLEVDTVLHCTKNEKILCTLPSGTLFVLDFVTGCVKELFDRSCIGISFKVYGYTESLAHINGMEKVVLKNEQNDLDVCF
ncbi:hypothetical protein CASFOL_013241 [Castilleja foliolosa]|uniref:F-box domain-containing protein n=1 Tax=Castilleja foliolosa TaxID=1961234 RepID=A0ABD3DJF5_9LAMI